MTSRLALGAVPWAGQHQPRGRKQEPDGEPHNLDERNGEHADAEDRRRWSGPTKGRTSKQAALE